MDNNLTQAPMLEIPPEIRTYLESILADANMASLDEAMHEEMIKELFARVDNYITSVIIDALPPEKLEMFIKMNEEKKSREEIENFVKENLPNAQGVFTKAFMDFRDLYLGHVTAYRNKPESNAQADGNIQEEGSTN